MIHPDIEVVDLDPDAWGSIHEAFARWRPKPWGYVVHRAGTVERLAGVEGVTEGDRVDDPQALARRLRASSDLPRVVVLDLDGVAEINRRAAEVADPSLTQQQFRSEVERIYWSSPAVATDPEPPRDPWDAIRSELARRGPTNGLLIVRHAGAPFMVLAVRFEDGLAVRARCFDRNAADPVAVATDEFGSVDLLMECEWSDLTAILAAPDRIDALAYLIDACETRGLEGAAQVLRSAGRR